MIELETKNLETCNFKIYTNEIFKYYISNEYKIPSQSWKIHISAFFNNYFEILSKTSEYCIKKGISFKWIYNYEKFANNLSKTASRMSSGKFITIYPRDDSSFKEIVQELYVILAEYKACDIVTDRRYKDSVIHYRYGSNYNNYYIGENGEKINDRECAYYVQPYFVEDPFGVKDDEIEEVILNNRYVVLEVIHVSNSSVAYKCIDKKTNLNVLLKETREYLGINERITYSFLRKKERENLKKFNYDFFQKYIDEFYEFGRYYLVTSYFEGINLQKYIKKINLFYSKEKIKEFEIKIKKIYMDCLSIVKKVNNDGYFLNDISESNFVIDNDGSVKFIDLEYTIKKSEINSIDYNIKYDEIFKIDSKYMEYSDELKLSYAFLKAITNYNTMKVNSETKINLLNNFFKDYRFSSEFLDMLFSNIRKYNLELYNKIFVYENYYQDIKVTKVDEGTCKKNINIHAKNVNEYIDNLHAYLECCPYNIDEVGKLYKKLITAYKLENIEYNYIKYSIILLKCYKILNLEKLPDLFYQLINTINQYITNIDENLALNYIDDKKSPGFRHGNAGIIVLNYEYKKIFGKDLIDIKGFINLLKYNYTNKVSFDFGILGVIYALKCVYNDTKDEEILNIINQKDTVLKILMSDQYYNNNRNIYLVKNDSGIEYYTDNI